MRLLTRSAPGPDEVAGDLADPASLDRAMAGADAVFLLSPALADLTRFAAGCGKVFGEKITRTTADRPQLAS